MRKIGIIGFGSFGQFMSKHLTPFCDVQIFDEVDRREEAQELGVEQVDFEDIVKNELLIIGIPVQYLEDFLKLRARHINPMSLLIDVSSVKVYPLGLYEKYLPDNELIGTHPLFGPQSAKDGIKGLNMVICESHSPNYKLIYHFLSKLLKLNVLVRTPELHDQQMGYVQALTHFVGRAVNEMDIPDVEQKTKAYDYLLDLKRTLGRDSWDLFITIERYNPYAKSIRDQFMSELQKLGDKVGQ